MHGVFATNAYLEGRKFDEPWEMLSAAAGGLGISLSRMTNSELALPIGDADAVRKATGDADFVLFWDKDVACAENLEACGIRVFNPSGCVGVCDDKALTHLALARSGVPSIETVARPMAFGESDDEAFVDRMASRFGFPMVVKDRFGSFGEQVRLVGSEDQLKDLLTGPYVPRIVQPYIECGGRDVRVEVVGGRVVAAMARKAAPGDFRSNATIGGSISAHIPDEEEAELAIRACEAVGADFAGVDIMRAPEGPVVCEVNSNAHLRNLLSCTGIDASVPIMEHIAREVGRRPHAG